MTFQKLDPKTLREHKGVSYVGVTTTALCHDGKGHFLMMKRGKGARDEHGMWDIVGGGLKAGEPILENLKREIDEELCVEVEEVVSLGYRDVHRKLYDGTKTHWVALDHLVRVDPKLVKVGEPEVIDEIGWFTLEKLPFPLHSQFPAFLAQYQEVINKVLLK